MNTRHLPTVLIVLGLIAVAYFSITNNMTGNPHGSDREAWIKEHGATVLRNHNPDEFCIKCHKEQKGQTKENFCLPCHKANGVEWTW